MLALPLCAQSLVIASMFVVGLNSPGAPDARLALSDGGAAAGQAPALALLDQPQENQRRPGARSRGPTQSAEPAAGGPADTPPVVRLKAAVYRLALSTENVVRIDAATLARAASLAEFDQAVRALGEASVLYRVDQTINLRGRGRIHIAADQPYRTGVVKTKDGRRMTSVSRKDVGVNLKVAGDWVPGSAPKRIHLSLEVEISAIEVSQVEVGDDVASPIFRKVLQYHGGPVELGHPAVLLNLDGACTDESGNAVAFLTRVVLCPAAPQADTAPSSR